MISFENVYVNEYHPLQKREHRLKLVDSTVYDNWQDFSRFVVWYGKMGWSSYKDDVTEIV